MRAYPWFLIALLAGCHPSATVQNTMPVANLQSYRTVALRVQSTAFASQGLAMSLEAAVLGKLHEKCGFESISRPGGSTKPDVVLDLNITKAGRGGGWVSNDQQAVIETLLVLSDGESGDLIGTARIEGKSSGMVINNGSPENEAVDVVAKTVADLLAKSGCSGPRIAKVEEPPPGPGPGPGPGDGSGTGTGTGTGDGSGTGTGTPDHPAADPAKLAEAEALNEDGKEKLRGANMTGALEQFQKANALVPDARFQFNICLAYEALQQWEQAAAACKQARGMNPEAKLATKIDHRLELIAHKQ